MDQLDAIAVAKAAGATPEQLAPTLELQRQAQWPVAQCWIFAQYFANVKSGEFVGVWQPAQALAARGSWP